MKAVTHLTLLALLFVNTAASLGNSADAVTATETATSGPIVAATDTTATNFPETASITTNTPSFPTATSPASPISSTHSSSTILTPTAIDSESTTNANSLATSDIITTSSTNDGLITTVSSETQSKNEMFPTTKDNQSSGPPTGTPLLKTSTLSSTGPSTPCQDDPCADNSLCVELHNTSFCLCLEGYYYNSSTCKKGKVFPGTISVKVSEAFDPEEKHSMAYQDLHSEITSLIKGAFGTSVYGQTVILNVSTPLSSRSEMRADDKFVKVKIVTILTETTSDNEKTVTDKINKAIGIAIGNSSSNILNYNLTSRCDYYGCNQTMDDCPNGLACSCKPDLQRPNPQSPFCVASSLKCPDACNAEHKQCLIKKNDGAPKCACVPGYQEDANGNCQKCAFGYSGLDCKDKFQLILTIVGTIAGVVILSMIIALIVTARSNNKKKDIEEENLIDEDFQNLKLRSTGFTNPGAEGSIFPKVRIAASRDSQMQNPYASQSNMPRPDY
ncbi:MUC13 isoform 1 [Pongo abelii]|uniref:MUC13 isoform 1 n=1 Tax=Pongo abelii TaxID=9601 RepID=H2P9I2_PONAB|nr:mucin-13 [Pongo pygmaeus]PNJ05815.1 MUC13 isoform 1 [Pongo abelii]